MATEMEKDALLEILSGSYVLILRSEKKDQNDLNTLLELKEELYSTNHKEINYESVLGTLKTLRAKYE